MRFNTTSWFNKINKLCNEQQKKEHSLINTLSTHLPKETVWDISPDHDWPGDERVVSHVRADSECAQHTVCLKTVAAAGSADAMTSAHLWPPAVEELCLGAGGTLWRMGHEIASGGRESVCPVADIVAPHCTTAHSEHWGKKKAVVWDPFYSIPYHSLFPHLYVLCRAWGKSELRDFLSRYELHKTVRCD